MSLFRDFCKRNCRTPLLKPLAKLGKAVNRYYENLNYDYASNGEERVVKVLEKHRPRLILDVGAYRGTWATMARAASPESQIYCFEPVPWALPHLKAQEGPQRLKVFGFGLGSQDTTRELTAYGEEASHLSNFYDYPHGGLTGKKIPIEIRRGDAILAEHGIDGVDFVKIDTEGSEFEVLKGFEKALSGKKLRLIQFEYGQANILSHYLLKDHYEYLAGLGYRVGKIYPTGVDFSPYSFDKEDFIGPNFVAVAPGEQALARDLEG